MMCSRIFDALAEAAREHYDPKQISIQLHTFSSPEDFWNSYSPGSYDLIFLDIYIKQANGMDLAAQLREKGNSCALIFVTSSDAFCGCQLRRAGSLLSSEAS